MIHAVQSLHHRSSLKLMMSCLDMTLQVLDFEVYTRNLPGPTLTLQVVYL